MKTIASFKTAVNTHEVSDKFHELIIKKSEMGVPPVHASAYVQVYSLGSRRSCDMCSYESLVAIFTYCVLGTKKDIPVEQYFVCPRCLEKVKDNLEIIKDDLLFFAVYHEQDEGLEIHVDVNIDNEQIDKIIQQLEVAEWREIVG